MVKSQIKCPECEEYGCTFHAHYVWLKPSPIQGDHIPATPSGNPGVRQRDAFERWLEKIRNEFREAKLTEKEDWARIVLDVYQVFIHASADPVEVDGPARS